MIDPLDVGHTHVVFDVRTSSPLAKAHAWWTSESGVLDTVVMVGPTPKTVSACGGQGLRPLQTTYETMADENA